MRNTAGKRKVKVNASLDKPAVVEAGARDTVAGEPSSVPSLQHPHPHPLLLRQFR